MTGAGLWGRLRDPSEAALGMLLLAPAFLLLALIVVYPIAMLVFNHLFSGADAFVSSQLWDLPAQVEMRALPRGTGIGLSIPFR